MGALFGKDFPQVPTPQAVGVAAEASEISGLDVDPYDVEIAEHWTRDDFISEGESSNDETDYLKVYQEEEVLGKVKIPVKKEKKERTKAKDVGTLLACFRQVRKAEEMRSDALRRMEEIIKKQPELSALVELLKPVETIAAAGVSKLGVTSSSRGMVTLSDPSTPTVVPKSSTNSLGIRIYTCPICAEKARTHYACDAHIRKYHTKIKFGPCQDCGFCSWNRESFRNHLAKQHNK